MKAQNRVTKHAKVRLRERTDSNHNSNAMSRIVSKNGKTKGFYQGKFHQYLLSKSISGARVKVYQDNIYIFSKNSKRLITTYPVPDKYLPVEQYELSNDILTLSNKIEMYADKPVIVELKNGNVLKGYVDGEYKPDIISKFILVTEDDNILIELNDIKKIDIDLNIITEEVRDIIGV